VIIALKIIALAFAVLLASFGGWVVSRDDDSSPLYWIIVAIAFTIGLFAVLS